MANAIPRLPQLLLFVVLKLTVVNTDSIGFDAGKWPLCSMENRKISVALLGLSKGI
ncbi:MAG: hypothetical protein ACJAUP_000965 [Cellvibrionaceae bacterium]|jgi:hypothetical protein